jgi:hypothetical protein
VVYPQRQYGGADKSCADRISCANTTDHPPSADDIAQMLHDIVGHNLVVLATQARIWMERDDGLDQKDLKWLVNTAADTLYDLRRVVAELSFGVISEPSADGLFAWIRSLPSRVPEAVLRLSVIVPETAATTLSPLASLLVERVVREGITNAARHSVRSDVTVRVDVDGCPESPSATVTVASIPRQKFSEDAAPVVPGISPLGGISGLGRAITQAGGTLQMRYSKDDFFVIRSAIPIDAQGCADNDRCSHRR